MYLMAPQMFYDNSRFDMFKSIGGENYAEHRPIGVRTHYESAVKTNHWHIDTDIAQLNPGFFDAIFDFPLNQKMAQGKQDYHIFIDEFGPEVPGTCKSEMRNQSGKIRINIKYNPTTTNISVPDWMISYSKTTLIKINDHWRVLEDRVSAFQFTVLPEQVPNDRVLIFLQPLRWYRCHSHRL